MEFGAANRRYPYKWAKRRRYWPEMSSRERKDEIVRVWHELRDWLGKEVAGVVHTLQLPDNDKNLPSDVYKGCEDKLDAICCVAVGISVLEGRARAFGDNDSAIWVPTPNSARRSRGTAS